MKMDLMSRARERSAAPSSSEQGLALLASAMAAEIMAEARPEQVHGFYVAAGRRLAAQVDLADSRDLDAVADRINALWTQCGWGQARLSATDTGIRIVHRGAPPSLEGDAAGHWPSLFSALLEGAYDAWFRQLGSGPALTTRLVRRDSDLVELHHGG
jgi:hypothetical protein